MKTILKRIKTQLSNSTSLTYVKSFQICSPRVLPDLSSSLVPMVGIAPLSTAETWVAQKKQATHTVDIYVVDWLQLRENAIIGDTVKKGLLEIVENVNSVIRGNFLTENSVQYLSKPIEITGITYDTAGYGDSTFLFVATMVIQCVVLFDITLS